MIATLLLALECSFWCCGLVSPVGSRFCAALFFRSNTALGSLTRSIEGPRALLRPCRR